MTIRTENCFFANGMWHASASSDLLYVVNPATDTAIGRIPAGHVSDVHLAVRSANAAFLSWAATPVAERIDYVERATRALAEMSEEAALTITAEMGCPIWLSRAAQLPMALASLRSTVDSMRSLELEEWIGTSKVTQEPIGVVAAITPWNFPLYQIALKVGAALVAGCTVILKPSELTPFDALLFARALQQAELPHGVFNLVLGRGEIVGEALVEHTNVDMVSFTGSTRSGRRVAALAAQAPKKAALELGGKSANIILPDADLGIALSSALQKSWINSGQVCASLSRLLVHESALEETKERLFMQAQTWTVGDPLEDGVMLGPVASRNQQANIKALIHSGIDDGANALVGGPNIANNLLHGAYVQPTILTDVHNSMRVAREEIFGPVLCVLVYSSEAEAIAIANDSDFGLSGGVWAADIANAERVARRLRTGQVALNGLSGSPDAPFGGVKHSGNSREGGRFGIEEYLVLKTLNGAQH